METRSEERAIYVGVGLIVVVVLIVGLATYRYARATELAKSKADELIVALEEQGMSAPSPDMAIRTLGEDGGAICATADDDHALARFALSLAPAAGGPGARPIVVDEDLLQGEVLVVQIYCPEKMLKVQEFLADFRYAETAPG